MSTLSISFQYRCLSVWEAPKESRLCLSDNKELDIEENSSVVESSQDAAVACLARLNRRRYQSVAGMKRIVCFNPSDCEGDGGIRGRKQELFSLYKSISIGIISRQLRLNH